MSHRITTQTQIKDKALAIEALKKSGMNFVEDGNTIRITSGRMRTASINLKTGVVTGDTDRHSQDDLGALRQHYAEAEYLANLQKQGATVESREVLKDGRVKLVCKGYFG